MNFFARPTRSKRSCKKCAKRAQIGAKKCKRAQIQKTLPLNHKGFLTHVYLCLSEHPDTICREKCETTARKNLWRADFSKRNTFSFTSVNAHFRAETQRHVNLRYFGGPRCVVEKVQAVVVRNAFPSQTLQNALKLTCRKSARRCDTNWGVRNCVAGAWDCAPIQKRAKRDGFVAVAKTMAGVGHWKRIWKDACRVADAVQETLEVDVLRDQGGDFLRRVAFLSMKSSGLLPCFCETGAALRMTWLRFFVAGATL